MKAVSDMKAHPLISECSQWQFNDVNNENFVEIKQIQWVICDFDNSDSEANVVHDNKPR